MKRQQYGMTLLSFLLVMGLIGFFGFIAMRLVPVYIEYYSAVNDIKAVTQTAGAESQSVMELKKQLSRRFEISYVDSIDLNKHVKLRTDRNDEFLDLSYEVRKPLLYNLDFVAKFDRSFPVTGRPDVE